MPSEENGYGNLDLSPFKIYSKREITTFLRTIGEHKQVIRLLMEGASEASVTSILQVDEASDSVILDAVPDTAVTAHLLNSENVSFETVLDRIRIIFFSTKIEACRHAGLPALRISLPSCLIRLQRREFYRVPTPLNMPVHCTIHVVNESDDRFITVTLQNVSGGGVALIDEKHALDDTVGRIYKDCRIYLPDSTVIITTLQIRNTHEITLGNGKRVRQLGCLFIGLPKPMLAVVQRYITKLERGQNAKLHGMR